MAKNVGFAAGSREGRGLIPCGLGARDTLRMEAAMPLYGHEMDDEVTPLETGLGFAVKMAKEDFIGKSCLKARGEPKRKRVGLKVTGRGIIREDQDVYLDGKRSDILLPEPTAHILATRWRWRWWMLSMEKKGAKVKVEVRGRMVEAQWCHYHFINEANKFKSGKRKETTVMELREELRYSKSHEWVKEEERRSTSGLRIMPSLSLGDLVFVNLPEEGDEVTVGEAFADVESVKAVSDVYSPVSGIDQRGQ